MKTVLSFSGGMDSTALLLHLLSRGDSVVAITFQYGQRHQDEITSAKILKDIISKRCVFRHHVVDLSSIGLLLSSALTQKQADTPQGHYAEEQMRATVVPSRNAIFSSICHGVATSEDFDRIALAVHSGDHFIYPDCREGFYKKMEDALNEGSMGRRIDFYVPYMNEDKAGILRDANASCDEIGLDFVGIFSKTWTNYDPRKVGYTGSDVERLLAFDALGMKDPFPYPCPYEEVIANARKLERQYKKVTSP